MSSDHWPRNSTKGHSIGACSGKQKAKHSLDDTDFWINSILAVCFGHVDSFELDHFAQNFHVIFRLKVNNDAVFEAMI